MYYTGVFAALMALKAGSALAADNSSALRCGAGDPPDALLEVAKSMVKEAAAAADRTLEVDTFFHVVTTQANEGMVTDQMLSDQVRQELELGFIRIAPGLNLTMPRTSSSRCYCTYRSFVPLQNL